MHVLQLLSPRLHIKHKATSAVDTNNVLARQNGSLLTWAAVWHHAVDKLE